MLKKIFMVLTLVVGALACAPDDPEHPCDPESGEYTGCAKVGVGEECMTHEQCDGDNLVCAGGKCVCIPECSGFECGDDGCGGSCGVCSVGWQCDASQQCFDPCVGTECGDDGYGGSCGGCESGYSCVDNECSLDPTWLDDKSALTWQVEPADDTMTWDKAKNHCQGLSLAGGGWRLPDIGELRSLIRGCPSTENDGSCNVKEGGCLEWSCRDGSCDGCSGGNGPAAAGMYWPDEIQGDCCWYWSLSSVADLEDIAWSVYFFSGRVYNPSVSNELYVRCVR